MIEFLRVDVIYDEQVSQDNVIIAYFIIRYRVYFTRTRTLSHDTTKMFVNTLFTERSLRWYWYRCCHKSSLVYVKSTFTITTFRLNSKHRCSRLKLIEGYALYRPMSARSVWDLKSGVMTDIWLKNCQNVVAKQSYQPNTDHLGFETYIHYLTISVSKV